MDKRVLGILLIVVSMLLVFAALQPILPTQDHPFSGLSILGPSQTTAGYPNNVTVGQHFLLYGYINNQEGVVNYYQVLVKLGNQSTEITNLNGSDAPVIFTYTHVVDNNKSVVFPIQLTIGQQGQDDKLIFELWSYNVTDSRFTYTGIWNQLLLNVTVNSD